MWKGVRFVRVMVKGDRVRSEVSGREFKISSNFTRDSSGVVYLLRCKVCGKQYEESTFTPFRARFNNCKSASRRLLKGEVVTQAKLFEHFTCSDHHGFLEDVNFQIIDRVFGNSRQREEFWQFNLDSFIPEGLNSRFADL